MLRASVIMLAPITTTAVMIMLMNAAVAMEDVMLDMIHLFHASVMTNVFNITTAAKILMIFVGTR